MGLQARRGLARALQEMASIVTTDVMRWNVRIVGILYLRDVAYAPSGSDLYEITGSTAPHFAHVHVDTACLTVANLGHGWRD